jgi:trimeric autotransporter adhesin
MSSTNPPFYMSWSGLPPEDHLCHHLCLHPQLEFRGQNYNRGAEEYPGSKSLNASSSTNEKSNTTNGKHCDTNRNKKNPTVPLLTDGTVWLHVGQCGNQVAYELTKIEKRKAVGFAGIREKFRKRKGGETGETGFSKDRDGNASSSCKDEELPDINECRNQDESSNIDSNDSLTNIDDHDLNSNNSATVVGDVRDVSKRSKLTRQPISKAAPESTSKATSKAAAAAPFFLAPRVHVDSEAKVVQVFGKDLTVCEHAGRGACWAMGYTSGRNLKRKIGKTDTNSNNSSNEKTDSNNSSSDTNNSSSDGNNSSSACNTVNTSTNSKEGRGGKEERKGWDDSVPTGDSGAVSGSNNESSSTMTTSSVSTTTNTKNKVVGNTGIKFVDSSSGDVVDLDSISNSIGKNLKTSAGFRFNAGFDSGLNSGPKGPSGAKAPSGPKNITVTEQTLTREAEPYLVFETRKKLDNVRNEILKQRGDLNGHSAGERGSWGGRGSWGMSRKQTRRLKGGASAVYGWVDANGGPGGEQEESAATTADVTAAFGEGSHHATASSKNAASAGSSIHSLATPSGYNNQNNGASGVGKDTYCLNHYDRVRCLTKKPKMRARTQTEFLQSVYGSEGNKKSQKSSNEKIQNSAGKFAREGQHENPRASTNHKSTPTYQDLSMANGLSTDLSTNSNALAAIHPTSHDLSFSTRTSNILNSETSDPLDKIILVHSSSGGTGGGLGSRLLENLADNYPKSDIISACVLPASFGGNALQVYNSCFCLSWIQQLASGCLLFENGVLEGSPNASSGGNGNMNTG